MTSKVYKTAQGKTVDLGTIMLKNEHVRAVGNMNVNARGDKLDGSNRVVETKPQQIQRQNARTTNVSSAPVQTSAIKAKQSRKKAKENSPVDEQPPVDEPQVDEQTPVDEPPVVVTAPPVQDVATPQGGLAAAIARSREVKQELEKTTRQKLQSQGVRKI